VGVEEDSTDFFLTIILFEDFTPNKVFQLEVDNYQALQKEFVILSKDKEF